MSISKYTTVKVRGSQISPFTLLVGKSQTVYDLKEQIYDKINVPPLRQNLVFRGIVLVDYFSLGYYGVNEFDSIFLAIIKDTISTTCVTLVYYIIGLIKSLIVAKGKKRIQITNEIKEILSDPILIATSRISSQIQNIMEAVTQVCMTSNDEVADYYANLLLQKDDFAIITMENIPEGAHSLKNFYYKDEEKRIKKEEKYNNPTKINYLPHMSEIPLPVPWKKKRNVFKNAATMSLNSGLSFQEKMSKKTLVKQYSKQIELLKKMGFSDDSSIIKALAEANGNVQKAAVILKGIYD